MTSHSFQRRMTLVLNVHFEFERDNDSGIEHACFMLENYDAAMYLVRRIFLRPAIANNFHLMVDDEDANVTVNVSELVQLMRERDLWTKHAIDYFIKHKEDHPN